MGQATVCQRLCSARFLQSDRKECFKHSAPKPYPCDGRETSKFQAVRRAINIEVCCITPMMQKTCKLKLYPLVKQNWQYRGTSLAKIVLIQSNSNVWTILIYSPTVRLNRRYWYGIVLRTYFSRTKFSLSERSLASSLPCHLVSGEWGSISQPPSWLDHLFCNPRHIFCEHVPALLLTQKHNSCSIHTCRLLAKLLHFTTSVTSVPLLNFPDCGKSSRSNVSILTRHL